MGWITLSLRRAELQRSISDHNFELLQISRQLRELSKYTQSIADGVISPEEITSLGTSLFGDALDFMHYSSEAAAMTAEEQTSYYDTAFGDLTSEEYYNNPSLMAQAQLYFDESGTLDLNAIYEEFYETALKEYAEKEITPALNELQKEIENKQTSLQTLVESEQAEMQQLDGSISSGIQQSTIRLS